MRALLVGGDGEKRDVERNDGWEEKRVLGGESATELHGRQILDAVEHSTI